MMKILKEIVKELSENCVSILLDCFLALLFLGAGFHVCYKLLYRDPAGIWGYFIGAALAVVLALLIGFPVIAVCSLIRDCLEEKRNRKNAGGSDSAQADAEPPAMPDPDRLPDPDCPLSADELAAISAPGAAAEASDDPMQSEEPDPASTGKKSNSHGYSCSLFCVLFTLLIILVVAGLFVSAGSASETQKLFDAGLTAYQKEDYPAALKAFLSAAEKGHAGAQRRLGVCYYEGRGVGKDWNEAFRWFYEAAKRDDPDALYRLGLCYEHAVGTDRDMERALICWGRAAKSGHADAQCKVGEILIAVAKEYDEAIERLRRPAKQGSPYAMRLLAFAYECKKRADAADYWYREAVEALRKSVEQGDPRAMHDLAGLYRDGRGTAKDPAEADKWFERAAEAYRKAAGDGDPDAQCMLGGFYAKGVGVEKDEAEAVKWFLAAAEQGFMKGKALLGLAYFEGTGVEKDEAESVKWLRAAAEQGDETAQEFLAAHGK